MIVSKRNKLLAILDRYGMKGRSIPVNGHDIFVVERGHGNSMVLVHGYASCTYTWRHNIDYLSRYFRVITFDLPGFGLSRAAPGFGFTMNEYVDFVGALFAKLNIMEASLYGHSLGGTISVEFWRKNNRAVSALILEAVPMIGENRFSLRALNNLLLFYYFQKAMVDKDLVDVFQCLKALNDKRCPDLLRLVNTNDSPLAIQASNLPTLILWGDNDQILSIQTAQTLKMHFTRAECHIIPRCGHAPHEEYPSLTHSTVKHFMRHVSL